MKILMLGWELPPHNSGGLGVACYQMAKALSGRGVSIDFMVPYPAVHHSDIKFMNIVDGGEPDELPDTAKGYAAHSEELIERQKSYTKRALKIARNGTHTAVHAHDWLTLDAGMAIKRELKLPLIAHIHATEYDRSGGSKGHPVIHEIERTGLLMADRIFAVSHRTKQIIVEKYDIPADAIEVVHNTIDHDDFKEPVDGSSYQYLDMMRQQGHLVVATVGRLTVQKGLHYFMRAAAKASHRLDRFVFVVGGDGELRDELIELSAEMGIAEHVVFTGFIRGKQWRDLYEQADIFVMSSVSEPFGLTAMEAAAHRSALILTKQSGVSEILSHKLEYDYWDENLLADQLINLASSKSLLPYLQHNIHDEVHKLNWDMIAGRCIDQYHRATRRTLA